ncbi:MAG TPA: glycosyltransferase family 4 protein [Chitinophagaceae bacterium]|nr:glycosyltransferase family 4 protein [Chitinophagaceae bacterium]
MQSGVKGKKKVSVLFIVPAPPDISPGQRFRFEHYLSYLSLNGLNYNVSSFYSKKGWDVLYKPGKFAEKFFRTMGGFFRRIKDLFKLPFYNYIYIYREAAPAGPPLFEWMAAKIFRKKLIYDFDDAIWIPITSEQNKIALYFRWFSKIGTICKLSHIVSTGNDYLAAFAKKYNQRVVVIPTVVNTGAVHNRFQDHRKPNLAIGWTGTFSTLKYLNIVLPSIKRLQEKYDFTFIVIANKDPKLPLKNYRFIQWTKENEVDDLLNIQIGMMPLYDGDLEKGKCGFKAIQFMSLGIPVVVSPVGVNTAIVTHGKDGFVASTDKEWEEYLEKLLTDAQLRSDFGTEGSAKIQSVYSVNSTVEVFLKLFDQ